MFDRFFPGVGAAALVLLSGTASAQEVDTNRHLADGISQVEQGDLEAAVLSLSAAVHDLEGAQGREEDLANAHLYLAMAHLGLSEWDVAKYDLREAWRKNHALRPDPKKFPPRVRQLYLEVNQEAASPTPTATPIVKRGGHTALFLGVGAGAGLAIGAVAARGSGSAGTTPAPTATPIPTPAAGTWVLVISAQTVCICGCGPLTLNEVGTSISGFWFTPAGQTPASCDPVTGTQSGKQVAMTFPNPDPVHMDLSFSPDCNTLSGTWSRAGNGDNGPLTLARQSPISSGGC
jgi:hypothetical protein